ncbi:hypothetical protein BGZ94_001263 [Podila epigama]|nr:hypothetical protein BGZ94_001263 [Podila epigama]
MKFSVYIIAALALVGLVAAAPAPVEEVEAAKTRCPCEYPRGAWTSECCPCHVLVKKLTMRELGLIFITARSNQKEVVRVGELM